MSPFRLAILSLLRRQTPTVITAVSIAISVACSGILLRLYHLSTSRFDSLGRGWEAVVGAKAGGIEILLNSLNGEGPYPDFLPYALFESLRAARSVHFEDGHTAEPKYVKTISPFLYFAKLDQYRTAGTDEDFIRILRDPETSFREGRWAATDGEVVVGSSVAENRRLQVGDTVQLHAWVGDHLSTENMAMKVVGLLAPTKTAFDRMLFAPVTAAQKAIAANRAFLGERTIWGERVLNYFFINLQPAGFPYLEALINKRTVGQVVRVDDEKRKLEELTGAGKSIGLFVSVFVILLSSLSVAAMLITRFEAMTLQLAVLRAIGYSRNEIGTWLIWEGLLLGLVGCGIGALLDAAAFPILRELLGNALPPPEVIESSIFESLPIWVLALVATVSAIFIPLIRLYRQDVHQALKS